MGWRAGRDPLESIRTWRPEGARVVLAGDRFYDGNYPAKCHS